MKKSTGRLFIISFLCILCSSCTTYINLLTSAKLVNFSHEQTIPYQHKSDFLIIPVKINGKTHHFLFDTGFTLTTVSKEIANNLNLKVIDRLQMGGTHGVVNKLPVSILDSLRLGNATIKNVGVLVLDMNNSPAFSCLNVDGIIGMNVIRLNNWKIDFARQTLTMQSINHTIKSGRISELPLSFKVGIPYVKLFANGNETTFMIDLGSNSSVIKIDSNARNKKIIYQTVGTNYLGAFHYTTTDTTNYVLTDLTGGDNFHLTNVVAMIKSKETPNIGLGFLRKYYSKIYFNFKDSTLQLYPRKEPVKPLNTYPFSPLPVNGKLIIGSVKAGFERADIGDKIIKMGSVNAIGHSPCQLISEYSKSLENSEPLSFVILKNGETKKLTVKANTIPNWE